MQVNRCLFHPLVPAGRSGSTRYLQQCETGKRGRRGEWVTQVDRYAFQLSVPTGGSGSTNSLQQREGGEGQGGSREVGWECVKSHS